MKLSLIVILCAAFFMLNCSSAQDRAYKAQEKVHQERLNLINQYKECLQQSGDDPTKKETCDQYLKAAEALK